MFTTIEIKDVKVKIGGIVKQLRKRQKLTQVQMSETLGISRATLRNLESGKNFTIDTLFKVLKELQLLEHLDNELDRLGVSLLGLPAGIQPYKGSDSSSQWSEPESLY